LSDGYDDIAIFKKAGFSVLLTPENSGTTQKISQKFKLRDYEVKERPGMGKELKFVMRWPWVVKAKKKRLAEALKKLNRKYR